MESIINFASEMAFKTAWSEDVCKLLILYFMCRAILLFAKTVINWRV